MIQTSVSVRDPFVLVFDNKYYMYGTRPKTCWGYADGFDVSVSEDLLNWSEPVEIFHNDGSFWADQNYWAPEVHVYQDQFYLFASFKTDGRCRGTQILRADSPLGPFVPISDGPVTPSDWECLDGTLYVDAEGTPYIVFCHEWAQIGNGTICAMQLSKDLTSAVSKPIELFDAKGAEWTRNAKSDRESYVTDGPFMWQMADGKLAMLWSSFSESGYGQAVAVSENGSILGPWKHQKELLFRKDGGHGMLFRTLDGQIMLSLHAPNVTPEEKAVLFPVKEEDGKILLSMI